MYDQCKTEHRGLLWEVRLNLASTMIYSLSCRLLSWGFLVTLWMRSIGTLWSAVRSPKGLIARSGCRGRSPWSAGWGLARGLRSHKERCTWPYIHQGSEINLTSYVIHRCFWVSVAQQKDKGQAGSKRHQEGASMHITHQSYHCENVTSK